MRFIQLLPMEEQRKIIEIKRKRDEELGQNPKGVALFEGHNKYDGSAGNLLTITNLSFQIKGLGISLVDFQPKEVCYISLYNLKGSFY